MVKLTPTTLLSSRTLCLPVKCTLSPNPYSPPPPGPHPVLRAELPQNLEDQEDVPPQVDIHGDLLLHQPGDLLHPAVQESPGGGGGYERGHGRGAAVDYTKVGNYFLQHL